MSILKKFNDRKPMFIISNFIDSPKKVKKMNHKRKEFFGEEILNSSRLMKGLI